MSRTSSATRSSADNLYGIRNQTGGPRAQAALAELLAANGFGTERLGAVHRDGDDGHEQNLRHVTATPIRRIVRRAVLANYNGTEAQHMAFATRYDMLPDG